MITWDEPKRRDNLRKHGIDLANCEVIFDAPLATMEETTARRMANSTCKVWGCFTGWWYSWCGWTVPPRCT